MLESQENRHFMRMAVNAGVKVTLMEDDSKQIEGICLDLSAEGLSLKLPTTVAVGEKLFVELLSSGPAAPLKVTAEVVRTEQLNDSSGEQVLGCRILSMN